MWKKKNQDPCLALPCPASGKPTEKIGSQEEKESGRLSTGSFRSSWALEMERDLQQQAEKLTLQPGGSRENNVQTTHTTLENTATDP